MNCSNGYTQYKPTVANPNLDVFSYSSPIFEFSLLFE
jgi:hypothetical protein